MHREQTRGIDSIGAILLPLPFTIFGIVPATPSFGCLYQSMRAIARVQ